MTPKEKAIELIDKYKLLCGGYWGGRINKEFAKQSAIIAVDEIINTDMLIDESTYLETKSYLHYWQQVKTEINAL